MKSGIDKIGFYTPSVFLDMETLAKQRGVAYEKYTQGLGVHKMAVCPQDQDIISMAANAADSFLDDEDRRQIDLVLFATESGLDYSKAAATQLLDLLNLNPRTRCLEIKQACYGVTGSIHLALGHLALDSSAKVLILGSDIARYGLESSGEPTQGAGAVAMTLCVNPQIMVIDPKSSVYSENTYDFYRPNGHEFAKVDGHYSNEKYQSMFETVFNDFLEQHQYALNDMDALIFHIPYPKIGLKSLRRVADEDTYPHLYQSFFASVQYNKQIGNIYTGSLYLSLISLLEQAHLAATSRIGLYSYGSGSVAEFFSGTLVEGYQAHLRREDHEALLNQREALSISAYEELFSFKTGNTLVLDPHPGQSTFTLKAIHDDQRAYENHTKK